MKKGRKPMVSDKELLDLLCATDSAEDVAMILACHPVSVRRILVQWYRCLGVSSIQGLFGKFVDKEALLKALEGKR